MASLREIFPFRVSIERDGDAKWYNSCGTWYQYSTWCNENFGATRWEFFGNVFMFSSELDQVAFMLRWK